MPTCSTRSQAARARARAGRGRARRGRRGDRRRRGARASRPPPRATPPKARPPPPAPLCPRSNPRRRRCSRRSRRRAATARSTISRPRPATSARSPPRWARISTPASAATGRAAGPAPTPQPGDPALPAGTPALADHVEAPPALLRRLAPDRGRRDATTAQPLAVGQRLVTLRRAPAPLGRLCRRPASAPPPPSG